MSAHVLLNLLNELGKRDKMRGLPSILSLFRDEFNKFNNTRARMLDSIYHMTLRLFEISFPLLKRYTCKAKRGRRPRVRSTPIDNTCNVQTNLTKANELENPVQKMAPPNFTSPRTKAEFVIGKIKLETSSQNVNIRKQVLNVSRVFCNSFITC